MTGQLALNPLAMPAIHKTLMLARCVATLAVVFLQTILVRGQSPPIAVSGTTTTLGGSTRLPGVTVEVTNDTGHSVAVAVSDADGRFRLSLAGPGRWTFVASLDGFRPSTLPVVVASGQPDLSVDFDLQVGGVDETIQVVAVGRAEAQLSIPNTTVAVNVVSAQVVDTLPVQGETVDALLPLMPGVIRGPDGRLNVKGGSESQTAFLLNGVSISDPSSGDFGVTLPVDAVDSVSLLPNPYLSEYGQFTSGVSEVETRAGTNKWRWRVNNFVPKFRWRDGTFKGIEKFTPRLAVAGPLLRDRVFLAQSARYRIVKTKVPARPEIVNDNRVESFDSFTQLDAAFGSRHTATLTGSFFPREIDLVNVDTFTPRDIAPRLRQDGFNVAITGRTVLSGRALLSGTLAAQSFNTTIDGQGDGPMTLAPDENGGFFFNEQRRETWSVHASETVTFQPRDWFGPHDMKAGVRVVHSRLAGRSLSRPVNIRRADGTLSQQLDYGPASSSRASSTDAGVFLQDHWKINDLVLLEIGGRFDWDGVGQHLNLSPRAGFSVRLSADGRHVLRGGAGLFFGQTPLNVQAFENYERQTVTYFADDGSTAHRVVPFEYRLAADATPSAFVANVEYNRQIGRHVLLKINHLRRNGHHEYLADSNDAGATLTLDSRGRSRYWELEVTSRIVAGRQELFATYVRSKSESDSNRFDQLFGNFRQPVIRANEFSLTDTDTPHRFLLRGTLAVAGWSVSPVFEMRQGLPYSLVDEERYFVGGRNRGGRFPIFHTLDLDVQRRIEMFGVSPSIGLRVFHVLGDFMPRDIQNNVHAAAFGRFSNPIQRSFGLTLQFD